MTQQNLADRDGWIWQNGKMLPWREANVHVLTHTLHYGVGVFEGVRAYDTPAGPCIFRLTEHTDRLFDSAHILGLKIPYSKEEVNAAQLEVFAANELTEGYLRPMVYLGSEGMGLRALELSVNLCVAAWPWPDYMDADSREKGIKVRTSSYTRHHVNITMCKAKANGNYITPFWRCTRPWTVAPMKRCCSTMRATWRKAPVRTFFWCRVASCTRPSSPPV